MNSFRSFFKPLMWSTALLLGAFVAGCGSDKKNPAPGATSPSVGAACTGAACVNLGTSANYVIFANTGIDTTPGASAITGSIGVGQGVTSTAITGFALNLPAASAYSTSTQVSGRVYAFDYAAPTPTEVTTASTDMGNAYTDAAGKAPAGGGLITACPGAGSFGGLIISAGVYTCTVTVLIPTGTIVELNGSATDVWVFRTTQGLTQAAATQVNLTGGALAKNVFWQVAGVVEIGTTAHMEGVILAQTAINLRTGATHTGRLLAQAAVNLDATTVTQP